VASKSEILSNCFEIFVTAVASFIAAALQSSGQFCYAAVISSTIVLILPGWLVCCAALELQSRSIVTGSVRLICEYLQMLCSALSRSSRRGDHIQSFPRLRYQHRVDNLEWCRSKQTDATRRHHLLGRPLDRCWLNATLVEADRAQVVGLPGRLPAIFRQLG
jgi:hypothetical protein